MKDLKYRTRGQTDPKGKPRVYFTCHPEDFDRYFETVVKELLDRQNCAVYYMESDTSGVNNTFQYGRMQLFVVPVTAKLLTSPNRAMDFDVPFAVERHIPVLPLMQESGLENLFSKRFGDLQFLDKSANDPTALPYDEKLTKYLDSVIVGDKLAAEIRKNFDLYIFLSYRKKDRSHAQNLMKLIHSYPFCVSAAIWYDEFLTPGEDFNDAIKEALDKSEIFAMTVTPNILEMPGGMPNFVMDKEYPAAREAGKNKLILPVEMVKTDSAELNERFMDIPKPVSIGDLKELERRLADRLRDRCVIKDDPIKEYYIGLAYLSGIDVEVDHKRALELISSSANSGYDLAQRKLVSMYQNGEGVKRDRRKAIKIIETIAEKHKRIYEASDQKLDAENYAHTLFDIGEEYIGLNDYDRAIGAFSKLLSFSEEMYKKDRDGSWLRYVSIAYGRLGEIAKSNREYKKAQKYYEKSMEVIESDDYDKETATAKRDLLVDYTNLGDLAIARGKLKKAREYYEKDLELSKALVEEYGTIQLRRDLSTIYERLGNLAEDQGKPDEAQEYHKKALEIREEIADETGTAEAKRGLLICYNNLGDVARILERFDEAREYYEKALEIGKALAEETDTIMSRLSLAACYERMGLVSEKQGNLTEARMYLEKALEINKAAAEETHTIESYDRTALIYYDLGTIFSDKDYLQKAEDIWVKLASERSLGVFGYFIRKAAMAKKARLRLEKEEKKAGRH